MEYRKFIGKWVSKLAGDFQTKYRDKQFEKKHTKNNAKIKPFYGIVQIGFFTWQFQN